MSWRHISRVYDTSQKKYTVKDTERLTNLTKESQWAKEWTKLGQWSDNRGGKELWTSTRLGTLTRDNYGTPKSERINDVDDIIFDEQIAGNTFFSLARGGSQTSPCEGPWSCGALPCQQVGVDRFRNVWDPFEPPCESHRHLFSWSKNDSKPADVFLEMCVS